MVKVASVSMSKEEITKNMAAGINGIVEIVPKKWDGIRSFHLKLLKSLALPLYQAVPDLKLKIEGAPKEEEDEAVVEEQKVNKETVGKKNGRIHEVRYTHDVNNVNEGDENELGSNSDGDIDDDEKGSD